jgi:hypothetical protein
VINKRSINAALKRAGLPVEIQNHGDGVSYFTSTLTGGQVGESVLVCYLKQQSIEGWVSDARFALKQEGAS